MEVTTSHVARITAAAADSIIRVRLRRSTCKNESLLNSSSQFHNLAAQLAIAAFWLGLVRRSNDARNATITLSTMMQFARLK